MMMAGYGTDRHYLALTAKLPDGTSVQITGEDDGVNGYEWTAVHVKGDEPDPLPLTVHHETLIDGITPADEDEEEDEDEDEREPVDGATLLDMIAAGNTDGEVLDELAAMLPAGDPFASAIDDALSAPDLDAASDRAARHQEQS